MKQSQEILGMPIFSIMDGQEIGSVKNIVINPERAGVEFLIVQNDHWEFGIKAIPYRRVEGIGDYAVTVENDSAVIDLAEIPIANDLLSKNIQIRGTRIITKKGRFLGQVTEYYIEEETGKIIGCVVEDPTGEAKVMPQEFVVTFGRDIMVVIEDGVKQMMSLDEFVQLPEAEEVVVEEMEEEVDTAPLIGRTLAEDLYDEEGNLLGAQGETVTESLAERARQIGRSKVVELTLKLS
ncbi:PRC-barrel domain-containing protein [Aneurinibacillus uraniidurans]|uniref:PRC-barrel domain-containing protein n=1 Tax=Aneurinibacillus uraniidurans TaxID=2966586 RepID=UPI0023496D68|nr:PRC-barrel domain-containing protein [Aneurinibacillus sp. B1]WCN37274.1 PRC-barrel domain-containing protein [Aneurinibacillus sp. B1]